MLGENCCLANRSPMVCISDESAQQIHKVLERSFMIDSRRGKREVVNGL
jgi:hypothetical protein